MQIVLKEIDQITPYENNAKLHDIEGIKHSIVTFGFNVPLEIDENGVIINGHGRYFAAKELNFSQIPCIAISHLSEKQKKAFRIADNKLAIKQGFDQFILKNEMEFLDEIDFVKLGFDPIEIEDLFSREIVEHEDEFQEEIKAIKDENAKLPIVPEFSENYECFVIMIKNEIDELFVRNAFKLDEVQGNDKGLSPRKSNVITVESIRELLCQK
jgi:hypothetical protein